MIVVIVSMAYGSPFGLPALDDGVLQLHQIAIFDLIHGRIGQQLLKPTHVLLNLLVVVDADLMRHIILQLGKVFVDGSVDVTPSASTRGWQDVAHNDGRNHGVEIAKRRRLRRAIP